MSTRVAIGIVGLMLVNGALAYVCSTAFGAVGMIGAIGWSAISGMVWGQLMAEWGW